MMTPEQKAAAEAIERFSRLLVRVIDDRAESLRMRHVESEEEHASNDLVADVFDEMSFAVTEARNLFRGGAL